MKESYSGIDLTKFFFACMIPFLHIYFGKIPAITVIQQYISRLGVPFFFVSSGFFLSQSIKKRGNRNAFIRHEKRIAKMLLIWLAIYSPILLYGASSIRSLVKDILFLTPAYLWYLTAVLVASVPFCFFHNRKQLLCLSVCLYLFGTLISESYSWLTGGFPAYTSIFITPRNGLFFALPMMCVGELAHMLPPSSSKKQTMALLFATVALYLEITLVGRNASARADRSMYLLLPIFTFYLLRVTTFFRGQFNTQFFRGASVAIYVMQFGFITVLEMISNFAGVSTGAWPWIVYFTVILGGSFSYWICQKNKLLKNLF